MLKNIETYDNDATPTPKFMQKINKNCVYIMCKMYALSIKHLSYLCNKDMLPSHWFLKSADVLDATSDFSKR